MNDFLIDVPPSPRLKRCRNCHLEKPLDQFPLDRTKLSGRLGACLPCIALKSKDSRERRKREDPDKFRWENSISSRKWRATEKGAATIKNRTVRLARMRHGNPVVVAKDLLFNAKRRAKERDLEFSLTMADVVIPSHCPVLGIPLMASKSKVSANSPSLDRIDPLKGYVPGNVAVISFKANTIKSDATAEELERVLAYVRRRP